MADPVRFDIKRHGTLWVLTRDGEPAGDYSHVDRATHDAVARARELQDTGEPAEVLVHAEGKVISIDLEPDAQNPDLADGASAFTPTAPL